MPSPIDVALADLARTLDDLEVSWFLFGAQAAILYGSTRVTEDIDVTLELGERSSQELVRALARNGIALRVDDIDDFVKLTRVLPMLHEGTNIPIDLVLSGPGLEEIFLARVRRHERLGRSIPVASPEDLVVMKLLAGRPRDVIDIRAVLRALGSKLDTEILVDTLRMLEEALGQSDLQPRFYELQAEVETSPPTKVRSRKKGAKRKPK